MKSATYSVIGLALLVFVPLSQAADKKAPSAEVLDQRLQRVERILDNQVLLDMLQRIESVQREVRLLRGEIERLDHEMEAMSKRQRNLYLDTDRRLQALEARMGGQGINPEDMDGLPPLEGELAPDGNEAVMPPAEEAQGESTVAAVVRQQPQPGEKEAYTKAYDVLMAGNNAAAIELFDSFLASYPAGPFSDNAWYWRGEALYVARKFDESVKSFGKVVNEFSDSPKVPDAKLKIAYALYEQNKFEESRALLESLIQDHPGSSAARLAGRRLESMSAQGQ
ncbi:MAG: tol-pal system protein YbgF [Gammaproteobacteria bacterium]|nr:tol-pal system protein YbgF [Gammaproteobacteria bacterium]